MNGSEAFVPIDASRLNEPFDYKAVSVNQDVADAVAHTFVWTGANVSPRAVENITIYRDADKNAQTSFPVSASLTAQEPRRFWEDIMGGLNTFTADASIDVLTKTSHGLTDGQEIAVSNSGGALPVPLETRKHYYVRDVTANTFKLARSVGGSAVNITTNGTGTNSYAKILRHMPFIVGVVQQAILEKTSGTTTTAGSGGWLQTKTSTHTNQVVGAGVRGVNSGGTIEARRIFGAFTEAGAFVEVTFGVTTKNPTLLGTTRIGLLDSGGSTKYAVEFVINDLHTDYGAGGPVKIELRFVEAGSSNVHSTIGELFGTRYRVQISGGEVRVYRNYASPGTVPVFRSTQPIIYPLTVAIEAGQRQQLYSVTIGGLPEALTTYPATDQAVDFGTAPSTVRFRVYEERVFQGVSFLGNVTDFTT
jgi:hypothetical protein